MSSRFQTNHVFKKCYQAQAGADGLPAQVKEDTDEQQGKI